MLGLNEIKGLSWRSELEVGRVDLNPDMRWSFPAINLHTGREEKDHDLVGEKGSSDETSFFLFLP